MTIPTPMEDSLARLTEKQSKDLDWTHQAFIDQRISQDDLESYLSYQLGWPIEAVTEYVNAACDACDNPPLAPPSPNAQLAPDEPVERPRGTLSPRYGPKA